MSPAQLKMTFSIMENVVNVRKQYVIYDFNSFIADVGGFMGLLLGFSLLSIYDEIEGLIKKLKKKMGYRRRVK